MAWMPRLTRREFGGGAIALAALGPVRRAAAQDGLVLRPGTRVVWYGGAASIPGEREQIVPDANGEWENQRTGERYTSIETPGPAGAGYVVMDILAMEPGNILVWMSTLLMNSGFGGAATFIDANGIAASTGNIADYWVSPAYLEGLGERNDAAMRILRMPYQLPDGQTFRAIRIQSQNAGGWNQNTYDLESGLSIATGSTAEGSPTLLRGLGNTLETGSGSTQLAFTRFASTRETALPGAGETFPDSMRSIRAISYSGSKTVTVAGGEPFSVPIAIRYDVVSVADAYLNARMGIAGTAVSLERVIPAGVVGSLWMNPRTLARYAPGETIDSDPVTGVQTVALGAEGDFATLALQTSLTRHAFTYDLRSGMLVRAELGQQSGIASDLVTVALASVE